MVGSLGIPRPNTSPVFDDEVEEEEEAAVGGYYCTTTIQRVSSSVLRTE